MKEFATALAEAVEPDDEQIMEFKVDDRVCRAYRPDEAQLAVLLASVSRATPLPQQIAGVINFFTQVLDDESHGYIVGRLLDRRDPYGIAEVQEIIEWMVEEWSGYPTQPPSASTQSQRPGGRKSTQPTPKSNSSDSDRAAS